MKDKKRIVFITGGMGKGGAERVISIIANEYALKGWNVDILMLLNNHVDYQLEESVNLIPMYNYNKSRYFQLPDWINSIRKFVIKNKPDCIVSFFARINIITLLACLGLNKKIVISERNDPKNDGRSVIIKYLTEFLYPFSKKIVFQTNWAQSCFSKRVQKKGIIIPNPIDVKAKAINSSKKIVAVGRLIEQKNHILLINAFKEVHDDYPDYRLYIYGEGRLRGEIESLIKTLKLEDSVFLPGNIMDIHEKISDAEMFVLSSNFEGLSNALLEAMMMGLPCISTNCAGSNEVINNEVNGLLVPIGDKQELTMAMKKLIVDKKLAHTISSEAKLDLTKYKAKNILAKWSSIIDN